jgi:hypothetical protein
MFLNTMKSLTDAINKVRVGFSVPCLALILVASTSGLVNAAEPTEMAASPHRTAYTFPFGDSIRSWFGGENSSKTLPARQAPNRFRSPDPDSQKTSRTSSPSLASELRADADKIQQKLTYRYANPVVVRFQRNLSAERSLRLYMETSQMIDARHLKPTPYATRTRQAVKNLLLAVENPEFLRANGLSPANGQVKAFRDALTQMAERTPVRTSTDALNMLYRTIDMAGRQLGLRPAAVATEFVYGATETLDKYSAFAPSADRREPSADLEDHVVGIGVEIKPHDSGALIMKTLRGGPAAAAGLKRGDMIVSVNGKNLKGKNLD